MGVVQPVEESERGDVSGDVTDFEAPGTSGISDVDDEFVATTSTLQSRAQVPGFPKRTYGVQAAFDDSCLEHTVWRCCECAKLDQQLDGLREMVPSSSRRIERNESVILDAYYYIAALQKQVEDLNTELLEDVDASVARTHGEEFCEGRILAHHRALLNKQPLVEVMKRDGVLEVSIVCANRPRVVVDIMEAVESLGLIVTHAKISCHSDLVFEHLSLESEESVTQKAEEVDDEETELDTVKALLVNAIICGTAQH